MYGARGMFGGMDPMMILAWLIGLAILGLLAYVFLVWGDGGRRWDEEAAAAVTGTPGP